MTAWRTTLIPGLFASELTTLLNLVHSQALVIKPENICILDSGIPVCVLHHDLEGLWQDELALVLSELSGGWILTAECNQRLSTWSLMLVHAGRKILCRRQSQETGTESKLALEFDDKWNRLGFELFGESSTSLVRQCQPAKLIRNDKVLSIPKVIQSWWILTEKIQLDLSHFKAVVIFQRLDDIDVKSLFSTNFSVIHGIGDSPPIGLVDAIRKQCYDAVLLSALPSPLEVASLARRLGTVAGVFVAPKLLETKSN